MRCPVLMLTISHKNVLAYSSSSSAVTIKNWNILTAKRSKAEELPIKSAHTLGNVMNTNSLRRSQTPFISIQIKRYYDATASYLESSDFKSQLRGRPSLPRYPVIFLSSSKQNITPVYDTIVSFHVLPNSLLSNHPTLPRHNLCCCHWQ